VGKSVTKVKLQLYPFGFFLINFPTVLYYQENKKLTTKHTMVIWYRGNYCIKTYIVQQYVPPNSQKQFTFIKWVKHFGKCHPFNVQKNFHLSVRMELRMISSPRVATISDLMRVLVRVLNSLSRRLHDKMRFLAKILIFLPKISILLSQFLFLENFDF